VVLVLVLVLELLVQELLALRSLAQAQLWTVQALVLK
jgi:hypothetical protein